MIAYIDFEKCINLLSFGGCTTHFCSILFHWCWYIIVGMVQQHTHIWLSCTGIQQANHTGTQVAEGEWTSPFRATEYWIQLLEFDVSPPPWLSAMSSLSGKFYQLHSTDTDDTLYKCNTDTRQSSLYYFVKASLHMHQLIISIITHGPVKAPNTKILTVRGGGCCSTWSTQ